MDLSEEVSFTTPCTAVEEAVAMSANDPLATILHYNVCMKASVGLAFGMRTCLHCPHCSQEEAFDEYSASTRSQTKSTAFSSCGMRPCQSKFGRNGRVFGGTYGLADGMCFATEHQGNDTPHGHGVFSPVV